MAIIGIKSLRYGVEDVGSSARFFADLGLPLLSSGTDRASFRLDDGSTIEVLPHGHTSLPSGKIEGAGVHEIVWGIDTTHLRPHITLALCSTAWLFQYLH